MYAKKKNFSFPSWLFLTGVVIYHEMMLHLWVADPLVWGRLAAVVLLGAGLGTAVSLLASLIPSEKWQKAIVMVLALLVTIFWLTEYFVYDAYRVFMTPKTILEGADGVAKDYLDLTLSLLARNWWRIAMMLLPTIVYGLLCRPTSSGWKTRLCLILAAGIFCGSGFLAAKNVDGVHQFTVSYEFGSAVQSMGLSPALVLELTQGSPEQKEPEFISAPVVTETTQPTETQSPGSPTALPGETQATQPTEPVYGDQVMEGVDFAELASKGSPVSGVYQYLASQAPAKKNAYTGLFKGKNLIFITAEAFTAEVIDPELTPTLYRLANEGIQFTDYYQPAWGASTTSGEYSNLMGVMPTSGGACMMEARQQKMFLTMGYQLEALGYKSLCYHANDATFYNRHQTHTNLGYEDFIAIGTGLTGLSSDYPYSDLELMNLTMEDYIYDQPFNIYYMSFSGHSPYTKKSNDHVANYFDQVDHLDHSDMVKGYLACQLDLEAALTALVNKLEELGIEDDTVIALGTDHYPYGLTKSATWKNTTDHMAELFGVERYDMFTRDHNALIIWSGCLEGQNIVVDDPVFSLDILPTLSNLFGVEYDSRLLVGRDVFSDQEPIIFWPNYSWKTDKGTYNRSEHIFVPAEGVTVEDGYVERIDAIVTNRITYSRSVTDKNFFGQLAKDIGR